jgi:hypothetical protein
MRRKLGIWGICALLFSCNLENAEIGHPETFVKYFDFGQGNHVAQTSDEGFICVGTYVGPQGSEAQLIKTDDAGNVEWLMHYPQKAGNHVAELAGGGYIFVGDNINGNASDAISSMAIMTTNNNGDPQDSVFIGDVNQVSNYHAQTFTFDTNGNLLVLGIYEDPNGFDRLILTKIDISGTSLAQDWTKTYGIDQNNTDAGKSIHLNSTGELIWSGSVFTSDETSTNSYLKVYAVIPASEASNGATQGENSAENFFATDITPIGNAFAIIGTKETGGVSTIYFLKVDHFGNIVSSSEQEINDEDIEQTDASANFEGSSVCSTFDSGLILLGTRTTPVNDLYGNGDRDFILIKTNNSGVPNWWKILGGSGDEYGGTVIEATDNSIVIFGTSEFQGTPRMVLMKTTPQGVIY